MRQQPELSHCRAVCLLNRINFIIEVYFEYSFKQTCHATAAHVWTPELTHLCAQQHTEDEDQETQIISKKIFEDAQVGGVPQRGREKA